VSKFVRIIGVIVPALLQVLGGHMNPVGQKDKKKKYTVEKERRIKEAFDKAEQQARKNKGRI
jgi:hypothetical protein